MKIKILSASLLVSTGLLPAVAGQPDPRFEGIWKGVETYQVPAKLNQIGAAPIQRLAVIAIGNSGKTLAVVQGLYPGRYEVSPNWLTRNGSWWVSQGNTLVFAMFDSLSRSSGSIQYYRGPCRLVLSPEGNTLTETGVGRLPYNVSCEITATFHRQGKK